MVFKINIGTKEGKTYHFELESEELIGKKLHDVLEGKDLLPNLEGYELEISGLSDKAGFTSMKDVEGIGLRKVLLVYGKAMKKRPKREGKKKRGKNRPKGLRLRKTVRGNTISNDIVQINLKILKQGSKKLSDVFEGQAQGKVKENRAFKRKQKKEKPAEEIKEDIPKEQ